MKKYKFVLIILLSTFLKVNAQTWQWAKQGGSTSIDDLGDLCTDANGNAYVIGSFGFFNPTTGYMIFDNDTVFNNGVNQIFLVKYSPIGTVLWTKSIGGNNPNLGNGSYYEGAYKIIYDISTNSILMTGIFDGTASFGSTTLFGTEDLFLAKLDLNGNFIWASGIYSNSADLYCSAIVTDNSGNIFISGGGVDSTFFSPTSKIPAGGFLAKYNSNGNILWSKKKFIESYLSKMKIYNNDIIALGSTTNDTAQIDTSNYISNLSFNMFFARFDTTGTIKWIKYPSSTGIVATTDMDMDAIGNFYIAGSFQSNINFNGNILNNNNNYDMFFVKYDSNGNVIWLKQANASNTTSAMRVATTSDGNTYVTGTVTGNATFGSFSINSGANNDKYISRYNSNGDCLGVRQLTGVIEPASFRIAADNTGNCFIAATFNSQINVGSTTLSPINFSDVFIAKHDVITGIEVEGRIANNHLIIYANPTAGKCNITVPDDFLHEKNLTLSIYDNTGKLIQQTTLQMNDGIIKLNLEAEAKGTYNVILSNSSKAYNGKIVFE